MVVSKLHVDGIKREGDVCTCVFDLSASQTCQHPGPRACIVKFTFHLPSGNFTTCRSANAPKGKFNFPTICSLFDKKKSTFENLALFFFQLRIRQSPSQFSLMCGICFMKNQTLFLHFSILIGFNWSSPSVGGC